MLTILTPPAAAPIDVLEARAHVRMGSNAAEDARLRRMIRGCANWVQTQLQRSLVATRLQLTLNAFPCGCIELEHGPVNRVVSVSYLDFAGQWQTVDPALYTANLAELPTPLAPIFGAVWPVPVPQLGAVRIVFDAGHAVPLVADAAANTITLRGPWPDQAVGATVRLSNSGGALPGGLQPDTDYFIQQVVAPGVYKLAATAGGAAIDITDAGTGTQFLGEIPDNIVDWMLLRVGSLFENRESEIQLERGVLTPLPFVDRLLDGHCVLSY